jgi:hypothetical protein
VRGQRRPLHQLPNWTPSIRAGTLTLNSFTDTLTFAGFTSPYITITASDP